MLNMTRQRAKPTSRKKLLIPRINKEVALSEKGRKRKSWGDDSDKEYEVESLVGNDSEVANEDHIKEDDEGSKDSSEEQITEMHSKDSSLEDEAEKGAKIDNKPEKESNDCKE